MSCFEDIIGTKSKVTYLYQALNKKTGQLRVGLAHLVFRTNLYLYMI